MSLANFCLSRHKAFTFELIGEPMSSTNGSNPSTGSRGGRPSLYRPEYAEQARKLCLLGATDNEMADFFGVNPDTIYRWQKVNPEFSESIARGKILADAEVAEKLFQRACGYRHGATKLYRNEDGSVRQERYEVEYPPDTQAISLWLRNRRKGDWREKHEVEVAEPVESLLDGMDEDRLIQLLMLRREKSDKHAKPS